MIRFAAAVAWTLLSCVAATGSAVAAVVDRFPDAAAAYLVSADDVPLWGARMRERLPPASLTKMMTALVVAESLDLDAVVTVSARAARAGGARMGLATGARLRVDALLAGLLLRSGNDACLALAERVAGTEEAFVARMNRRARDLRLNDTHFTNACGFDAPAHQASAEDLAALARQVLATPPLARLTAQKRHTAVGEDGKRYPLVNGNVLLDLVPGMNGVKTGYTRRAGRCLVGSVERDGHRVLVVLLGGTDRWWDAVAMIEQAFDRLSAAAPGGVPR
jgi:D-alanyl-D-alanine carboxypeptidase (penicillin-binding protein 5/6)